MPKNENVVTWDSSPSANVTTHRLPRFIATSQYTSPPDNQIETEVNARLSALLQHVLCGARIAHYIKVIIRDKVGAFITAEECEDYLRNWLFKYTTGREDLE